MGNQKTTIVAAFGGVLLLALVGALIFKMIDGPTFGEAAGALGTFLGVIIGILAQDQRGRGDDHGINMGDGRSVQ
jgi:hypothetical protein